MEVNDGAVASLEKGTTTTTTSLDSHDTVVDVFSLPGPTHASPQIGFRLVLFGLASCSSIVDCPESPLFSHVCLIIVFLFGSGAEDDDD